MATQNERAVLAGGCFWGMQDLLRRYPGVISTRVGYTGGDVPNATYRNHGTHAEALEIIFDPARSATASARVLLSDSRSDNAESPRQRPRHELSLGDLLHDRRAKADCAGYDRRCRRVGLWPGKVVTEVVPAGPFWEAEPEHQDYLEKYPNGYTCHFIRPNWRLPHRANV